MKGQVALEFIMMVIIGILFVLVLMAVAILLTRNLISDRQVDEVDDLAKSIQMEVIIASETETGYRRTLNIPTNLKSGSYVMTNTNSTLTLTKDGYTIDLDLPLINGTFIKGENTIIHENDTIYIAN